MSKKFFLVLTLLIFIVSAVTAQEKMKILGDRSFENGDYFLASEYYQKALEKDAADGELNFKLAECYRNFFDYDKAETYYKLALDQDTEKKTTARFFYALMLKTNGKYIKARDEFEYFIAEYTPASTDDNYPELALLHYNGCVLALDELKKPIRDYQFENVGTPVNSPYSEYAPVVFENDSSIYLTSARVKDENEQQYGVLGGAFTDNYHFHKEEESWIYDENNNYEKFKKLNTPYNDGAGTLNSTKDKYYVTICGEFNKDKTDATCGIFVSNFDGGKWTKPERLNGNINPENTWNAQPSLSPSGDTIFFVSKREGGYGQHDIWYSIREGEGPEGWGEAVNMGPTINTPYIDYSPSYFAEEGVLFFSSDGHESFGGLDIFMARGPDLDTIRNIGLPFNSNRDDIYFVLGENRGFLASNRGGGVGNDDIYWFNIKSRETLIAELSTDSIDDGLITIKGRIMDDQGEPAPGVGVLLADENDMILKRTETDEDGVFIFANLDPGKNYKVLLEEDDPTLTTLVDYRLDNVEVVKTEVQDTTTFTAAIEENKEEGKPKNTLVTGKILVENIYFDFNRSKITPQSRKVMNDLANYLESNDGAKIEITGYTDSKGTDNYNIRLGKRRAQAAYDYLIKKGIPGSAIVTNTSGESNPIASNNSEVGRQLNRRVEFSISGGSGFQTEGMAYVVEPNTSLAAVASQFNMTADEVKDLSGIDNVGSQYAVVRVRRIGDQDIIAPQSMALASVPATANNDLSSNTIPNSGTTNVASVSGENFITFNDTEHNRGVKYNRYDGGGYYVVLPGNTLFSIARVAGISLEELKRINDMSGNTIFPGQRLRISENAQPMTGVDRQIASYNSLANAGITVQDQQGETIMLGDEKRYVVKEGDTFWTICNQFNMTLEELRLLNGMDDYVAQPGRPLKVKDNDSPDSTEEEVEEAESEVLMGE